MRKIFNVLMLGAAVLTSFSGCSESSENSKINEGSVTETTEAASASETTTSAPEEIEITSTLIPETTAPETLEAAVGTTTAEVPEAENKADLSFLNGAPNGVIVWANMISGGEADGLPKANVDVIDTGSCYRLGVSRIQYYLGISDLSLSEAIYNSVQPAGYVQDEEGKGRFTYTIIPEKAEFTFFGEVFTLVSYYENDAGRGYCEFIGGDGEKYYINNLMSPGIDNFTSEIHFKLVTEDGQDAYREIEFKGGCAYIDIPYDLAENTMIKRYVEQDEDLNAVIVDGDIVGGDPVGYYMIQFDAEGNVVKISGC